eukprot:gene2504-4865_t
MKVSIYIFFLVLLIAVDLPSAFEEKLSALISFLRPPLVVHDPLLPAKKYCNKSKAEHDEILAISIHALESIRVSNVTVLLPSCFDNMKYEIMLRKKVVNIGVNFVRMISSKNHPTKTPLNLQQANSINSYDIFLQIGTLQFRDLDKNSGNTFKAKRLNTFLCVDNLASIPPTANDNWLNLIYSLNQYDTNIYKDCLSQNKPHFSTSTTPLVSLLEPVLAPPRMTYALSQSMSTTSHKQPTANINTKTNTNNINTNINTIHIAIIPPVDLIHHDIDYSSSHRLFLNFIKSYPSCSNGTTICTATIIVIGSRLKKTLRLRGKKSISNGKVLEAHRHRKRSLQSINTVAARGIPLQMIFYEDKELLAQMFRTTKLLWILEEEIPQGQQGSGEGSVEKNSFLEARNAIILEAMSTGCIPLLPSYNQSHSYSGSRSRSSSGSTTSQDLTAMLSHKVDAYLNIPWNIVVETTCSHMALPQSEILKMRSAALSFSESRRPDNVFKALQDVLIALNTGLVFRNFVRDNIGRSRPQWSLQIHHSTGTTGNELFVRSALRDIGNVSFIPLPFLVNDQSSYNRVVKSVSFWSSLAAIADRVLIFQTDSVMLRSGIDEFLSYDYIGAPWSTNPKDPNTLWIRRIQRHKGLLGGVGNGGFSLRNPRAMLNIVSTKMKKGDNSFEDTFFIYNMANNMNYKLPKREVAYHFALEMICHDIPFIIDFKRLNSSVLHSSRSSDSMISSGTDSLFVPMAVHAAWNYLTYDDAHTLLRFSLPR